ncbi:MULTISPECIES: galactose oxidase-like domain-containing protein [Nocardioides]|uniref:Galactose oxidase-like domain-containing protein n=1 Tax=Nocardioides vastitatis TaxID=2568655 RepID=A0ABW0ZEQ4_9ACTN|nr:galactose oxidase-like domain-containing protein [Nocardioides sp.]THJ04312.1 DUF1929 domain-containing protein [Nocardioides sp.]
MRCAPVLAALLLVTAASSPLVVPAAAETSYPEEVGAFGALFADPSGHECLEAQDSSGERCKPTAVSVAVLPNGRILYWDGIEGMNHVGLNVVLEFGEKAMGDQARVLDLSGPEPSWSVPMPADTNGNPGGYDQNAEYLPLIPHDNDNKDNDGNLFCAAHVFLPDGRLLINGGTAYYSEPSIPGTNFGVLEPVGIKNTRIFDPKTNTFEPAADMSYGRWYPSTVTLPSGEAFTVSGVRKLVKPIYLESPVTDWVTNVRQTETYNPTTGKWRTNPSSADKSLPLYPRIHLLPNGKVYYDAAGQAFNPMGGAYDQALWNLTSVYDPATQSWKDLGVPVINGVPAGFRGSGFSVMLTLKPDQDGRYNSAEVLSGGGVLGMTPGTYLGSDSVTLNTIDTANGDKFTSKSVEPMHQPRWYASAVVLPDGKVFVANGANVDEDVTPGLGFPIRETEIFDPETGNWTEAAPQTQGRTYHTTATLLPDGRVMLGGHAPFPLMFGPQNNILHDTLGTSRNTTDPSFQIFSPPYLHWGERPKIAAAPAKAVNGSTMKIVVDSPTYISSVRMVRNPSLTHLVDPDQRTVELAVLDRSGNTLTLAVPDNKVLPPGPYMLFANRDSERGEIPSASSPVLVARS